MKRSKKKLKRKIRLTDGICPNCGRSGPHFVPPSCGEKGFYLCEKQKQTDMICPACGTTHHKLAMCPVCFNMKKG